MSKRAKIQIKTNNRGIQRWHYTVVGANGETMVVSERYSSRADCMRRAKRFIIVMNMMTYEDIEEV